MTTEPETKDEASFYVLDIRTVVGNCAMWWCPNSQGYTCNIDEAGLYTEAECKSMRDTDIPMHRDDVQRLIVHHVRLDHLHQAGHLDAYEKARAEQAAEEKRAKRRGRKATKNVEAK